MFFKENGQYRCAVYLRLSRSDGDQQESNSIKNQRALLNDYLGKHPELHKVDEYVDDGYSGTNFERPDFKRMIQDIENRKINCIIVKDLSRFGRNYIETGRYLERIFPFMGVRFIAINDHYDSAEENDDKGRILIPFNNLINDTYCRDISMRVRSHLDVKRKEGQFIGSFAGYGYQKDPKDKNHLIIDEYAAGIVQEIFKQKLNGMSSQRIASHLNELGVLPPNEYKRANGFNYTCGFQAGLNQKWTVVSVNRILKNESYTGTLIQGKRRKINYKVKKSHDIGSENWIRVEDAHDAIISKGEFQQVQQLLELDTRTAPSQTTVYPLSGFLRCADCGQNMIRRTVTKNGKKYQYYHCSTYKNGGGCTPHMINSEKLTESVLAAIRHQVTLLVEAEKVLSNAELASGEQIGIKILDSQITALEAELERYSNLKIRLYQDLCDDVVSREEYGEMNTRFAQKIKEAQDKIQEIREKKQEALKHDTLLPTWLEEFKQYEHIKTLERRVVVELIDHIDVELLLNSVERCIAIRPCDKNNPNAIRWGRLKEGRWCASTLGCRGLAKTLFDIMEWDEDLRYRFRGQFLEQGDNKMMLFAFDEPEMIKVEEIVLPPKENTEEDEGETVKKKIYIFPPEWAGTFGQPITSIAQVGILRQEHYAGNWDVFRPATEIEEMNIFTAESLNELLREAEKIMEGWTDYR